jgi:geranylgeranyl reductase family protein
MNYEVIIVGAGPAGSTAAKFLSEKGIKTLLIDKSIFPRDKPCGGGIPIRVLKRYKYINEKDFVESYSFGICVYSHTLNTKLEILKNKPLLAMVHRSKFDEGLVKLAIDGGTVFMDGKTVEHFRIYNDNVKVSLSDGSVIDSQIIIGADGIWSSIAKKIGLHQNCNHVGICAFQEYLLGKKILDQFFGVNRFVHIFLNIDGLVGYGWIFPKKEHVNLGIVEFRQAIHQSKRKINLRQSYENYLFLLKKNKILPDNMQSCNIRGAVYPCYPLHKTYGDRVVLCGDAGGFVNPASGEGIYNAMRSGEIAANVISEALENGDTSSNFLSKYQTLWNNDFGRDNKFFFQVSKGVRFASEKMIQRVSKDKKIVDMALNIITDEVSINDYKWKFAKRFIHIYFKDLFGKL